MPKKGESGKAKEGTKKLPEGIKCYSRYNNAGFVYSICDKPYVKGKAKVKGPPRGEFSAYYRGEDSKGPLEAYYMAPTIDPTDWLIQQGVKWADLSPAQKNEYHRLDMAKRRSERFSALSEAMDTGSGQAWIEYIKAEKEKEKDESKLEKLQKEAEKKNKALEVKYKTKGVVATTPEEVKQYYQNIADKNIKQLLDEDSIQQEITNRVEDREIELASQIKEGQENIVGVVNTRGLWKRPFNSYPKIERDFLEKSKLKDNQWAQTSMYRNKAKGVPEWITGMRRHVDKAYKGKEKGELIKLAKKYDGKPPAKFVTALKKKYADDEGDEMFLEIVNDIVKNQTPFVKEEELAEGQKKDHKVILKGAGEIFASDTLEDFSKNYLKWMTKNVRETRKGAVKLEKDKVVSNVGRARHKLAQLKKEARMKGKTNQWIDKYTKLIITSEEDLKDVAEAEKEGQKISSITLGKFEDYFKTAGTIIDELEDISKAIQKIENKKEKSDEDYEEKSKHLKNKKTLARLLKSRKEKQKELDMAKIFEKKKEAKEMKKLEYQLKQQGQVSKKIAKEIKEEDEEGSDQIEKILKQIEKDIEKHNATDKKTGEISIEYLKKQPPKIPPTIKGKKATEKEIKIAKKNKKKNKAGFSVDDAKEGNIQKHNFEIVVGKKGKLKPKKVNMVAENDVHIAIEQVFPDFNPQEIDEFIEENSLKNEKSFVKKVGLDTDLDGVEGKSTQGAGVGWKSWLKIKNKLKEEKQKK